MMSRYKVWLGDESLEEISPKIYVGDISYSGASPSFVANRIGANDGQFTTDGESFDSNTIMVSFVVREYNTAARQSIVQDVIKWASKGGWLKTSDRPGQMIYVRCAGYPTVGSVLRWTNALSVQFMAMDYPFWVDTAPETYDLNSGDEEEIFVPGFRQTFVEASIVPSETLTGFTLEAGDTFMEIDGVSIPADQAVTITYSDAHHILSIESAGVSLLDKRTPESSDDLLLGPGTGTVYFDCATSAVCTISVRGVYM